MEGLRSGKKRCPAFRECVALLLFRGEENTKEIRRRRSAGELTFVCILPVSQTLASSYPIDDVWCLVSCSSVPLKRPQLWSGR